jgi:antitoxin component YwqK of YwqJK toxin-antitoxin module
MPRKKMKDSKLFYENLELFARFWPKAALALESFANSPLEFCLTNKGELNLKKKIGNYEIFYHSNEGALDEAKKWLDQIFPIGVKVLFVYGIGLGYAYDVLEEWLKADPSRYLIFMEDDLAVLQKILETEKASKILQNTQAIIHYFETPGEKDWGKFRLSFRVYVEAFCLLNYQLAVLKIYEEERSVIWNLISNQIRANMTEVYYAFSDALNFTAVHAQNFYKNITSISRTIPSEKLFGEFKNIPSLICGAGPSINKQLHHIKGLCDKALIFASGTAINILNKNGVMPHFGACLDPDVTQESRFLTNFAYEVPFFYHNRFYANASKKIHGQRLLVTDTSGILGSEWFYKELGLTPLSGIVTGTSTSNFCNGLAGKLKCNPIIFAGLDLAYTDSKRYADGVTVHPTEGRETQDKVNSKALPTLSTPNQTDKTKWEWVLESSAITSFSQRNPAISLINATEGGMNILEVPNVKLKDVIDKQLFRSYDLQNWVHSIIQQSGHQNISDDKILKVLETWDKSLENCRQWIKAILQILISIRDRHLSEKTSLPLTLPGKVALFQANLEEEVVYSNLLKNYDAIFQSLAKPELNKLSFFPEQFDDERRHLWLLHKEVGRFHFLDQYTEIHYSILKNVLKSYKEHLLEESEEAKVIKPHTPLQEKFELKDLYTFAKGKFIIKDQELEIDFEEDYQPEMISPDRINKDNALCGEFIDVNSVKLEGQSLLLHPDCSIKGEMYYKEGKLHGPTSFYQTDGTLLARGWFVQDQRVGKNWQYYPNGNVFSLMKYKKGLLQGKQVYYYPAGILKSIINYLEGVLDGEISLYFPNGNLKRSLHFKNGKLHGLELMWNEKGLKVLEAEYKEGLPVGSSKIWFPNGQLSKQVDFHENSNDFDIFIWNEEGNLVGKKSSLSENALDTIIKKSNELKQMLEETNLKIQSLNRID